MEDTIVRGVSKAGDRGKGTEESTGESMGGQPTTHEVACPYLLVNDLKKVDAVSILYFVICKEKGMRNIRMSQLEAVDIPNI